MSKNKATVRLGLAAFVTVGAILLFYDTLAGSRVALGILKQLIQALEPILYGAFMAYLLAPVVNFPERKFFSKQLRQAAENGRMTAPWVRALSILLTWSVIFFLLYLLASVLVPELYRSVMQLVSNIETYYNTISGWVENLLASNPEVEQWVAVQMDTTYHNALDWVRQDLLPQTQTLVNALSGGVVSTLNFLKNLLVGIIVSVYFLATKELCAAHARKVCCALFSDEKVCWIMRGTRKADSIFAGFVRGKLLDSLIIGILCFAGCSILKMPYTPLVSVIVGVTNVIPFFGPFLGAIPSVFLILLVSPEKALWFAVFVLALQQLDGNVIGPAILGDSTGLSSLWVIIAILVGGSFFGVLGMFFGVPVCACIYHAVTFFVESRLRKRDMPLDTREYRDGLPEAGEAPDPEDAPDLEEKP